MRTTIVGSSIGLLLIAVGCNGATDGDVSSGAVEVKSQLTQTDTTGLVADDLSSAAVSSDVSAQIADVQSLFDGLSINSAGIAATFHTSGTIDHTNPFFLSFGTNGRTCETCHGAAAA